MFLALRRMMRAPQTSARNPRTEQLPHAHAHARAPEPLSPHAACRPSGAQGQLVHLKVLDLGNNNLTGNVPVQLGNLTKIQVPIHGPEPI